MVAFLGRACQDPHDALQSVRSAHNPHTHVDEWDSLFQQPVNDGPLRLSSIQAEESESDAFEEVEIVRLQRFVVFYEPSSPQLTVDIKKCLYF